jgi:competence protein ComEA
LAQEPQTAWPFQLAFLALFAAILAGVGLLLLQQASPGGVQILLPPPTLTPVLQVYVSGAVEDPGVHQLSPGARVLDALEQAGGATDNADLTALNLARRVNDEEHIVVPRQGEALPTVLSGSSLININTASAQQLEELSGIGPVLAQAIVDYREANGDFSRLEDLMQVSGIGPSTFQQIQGLISIY